MNLLFFSLKGHLHRMATLTPNALIREASFPRKLSAKETCAYEGVARVYGCAVV